MHHRAQQDVSSLSRRHFLRATAGAVAAAAYLALPSIAPAQVKGERPPAPPEGVSVLNPLGRVPVSIIIDDSTCLVNLNRFAVPQFAAAWAARKGAGPRFEQNWRDWPHEIPDAFVRKFAEWSMENGVKGKYSIVPYPACVGRIDRVLPGWTDAELADSIKVVREFVTPNWDIHPEMVTHTWAIDTKTGHPHTEHTPRFMENWEWSVGKSADELADYMAYALRILKDVGLPCEGITTPGGFGNLVMPALAQATLQSVRDVYGGVQVPHYFRNLYDQGDRSVAPLVQYAAGLDGDDPHCVVSIIGCTGDWTGGWDNSTPVGADAFITPDLKSGRLVDVIARGEPAVMVCHWTGVYFNGQELGFKIFQEVVRRLRERYGSTINWMKLSEISRYAAARELTRLALNETGRKLRIDAPFACPNFTLRVTPPAGASPAGLKEVDDLAQLRPGAFARDGGAAVCCLDLPKGRSELLFTQDPR
jgi:hypothetical protein